MNIQLEKDHRNLLVIDIETASIVESYESLDDRMQKLWDKKAALLQNADDRAADELFFDRGAIFAEFGKVICISVGIFTHEADGSFGIRIKSFAEETERATLEGFNNLVESKFDAKAMRLIAHNGKEFDFPYLCRRMLVNGVPIPEALNVQNKKPWEILHIDTMELWKFGDRKNFTSLDLLAALFGVESSKDDIDGSQVNSVYYVEQNLDRISHYCQRDVLVTAQVFLKLNGLPPIQDEHVNYL